jgi:hypothetical protein
MANIVDSFASCHPAPFVVYFFCRYDDSKSLLARKILGSISKQILTHLKLKMSKVATGVKMDVMGTDEMTDALLGVLLTEVSKEQRLCIVLDGVDECKESDAKIVMECLGRLLRSGLHIVHVVCSSRPAFFQWVFNVLPPKCTLSMSSSGCRNYMTPYVEDALKESLKTRRLS